MSYDELLAFINKIDDHSFEEMIPIIDKYINNLHKKDFINIIENIGGIPESIIPSSSKEKLYSKASDIVLARCFKCLGLDSEVLHSRGNSADVIATSNLHHYNLVADAKCFRYSRTAKNQKDYKRLWR